MRIANPRSNRLCRAISVTFLWATAAYAASTGEKVLYEFQGAPDGAGPQSSLAVDASHHLYGTTPNGGTGKCGSAGCGTVFELIPPAPGATKWTEKILYSFQGGNDGALPQAGLILGKGDDLYGTTASGGGDNTAFGCAFNEIAGCGTVFRLVPPETEGGAWTETVLYAFQGNPDGSQPMGSLVLDATGHLYGTTAEGGAGYCEYEYNNPYGGCGSVFKLSPPLKSNDPWTETILYAFNGLGSGYTDGEIPMGGVIFDQKGNLYGTTLAGGASCGGGGFCGGTVFELTPPAVKGNPWSEMQLTTFAGAKGGEAATYPGASLIFDAKGNLYGTTLLGGDGQCDTYEEEALPSCGTIFTLTPPTNGGPWTLTAIYSFNGTTDGAYPAYYGSASLAIDNKGNLYGATPSAGDQPGCSFLNRIPDPGCGTIWKLTPPSAGGESWIESTLHSFEGGTDGQAPFGGVVLKDGTLFGTTTGQGSSPSDGTVFSIVP